MLFKGKVLFSSIILPVTIERLKFLMNTLQQANFLIKGVDITLIGFKARYYISFLFVERFVQIFKFKT